MRKYNGITLISLILTIIVLLILASVALLSIQKDDIISHADNVVQEYNKGKQNEQEILEDYTEYIGSFEGEIKSIQSLKKEYEFMYYTKFTKAISDVNNDKIGENSDSDEEKAVAGIYLTKDNIINVVLLKNTTENEEILIKKDMIINLGGNTLNLDTDIGIKGIEGNFNKIVIDGRLDGSSIKCNGISNSVLFQTSTNNLWVKGGKYNLNTSNGQAIGISINNGNATFSNCTIDVYSKENNVCSFLGANNSNIYINETQIIASAEKANSYGIFISNGCQMTISETDVFADASDCTADSGRVAIGIMHSGILNFKSGSVTGTHSGMQVNSGAKTYISGGTFSSCCHGGIYFAHGETGEAYVENATISCKEYTGKYKTEGKLEHLYGCMYIGGGSQESCSNMKVYINNCNFTGQGNPIILRGTGGEHDNSVYISNSTIGSNKIRIDNQTMKLYIGRGCNFNADNTNFSSVVFMTDAVYMRK